MSPKTDPIVVIGGGAAGMIAAGAAAHAGARVVLLEKTPRLGRKLAISGKTRCNITNTETLESFLAAYGPNGRFLRGPFSRFFRDELLELLRKHGVETQDERGGRVFPVSGNAEDVVVAFERFMAEGGVEVRTDVRVAGIETDGTRVTGVRTTGGVVPASAVILATGGSSYTVTGSTGDGYVMAEKLGHTIVPLRPALVPLIVEEIPLAKSMQGVSLKNVRLTAFQGRAEDIDVTLTPSADTGRGIAGKKPRPPVIESRMGEMMVTHFGIGGPVTLLMSLAIVKALEEGPVSVSIDLKPAVNAQELRMRLQREFEQASKRTFRRILGEVLPSKMIEPYIILSGVSGEKLGHQITGEERDRLLQHLKSLRFNIKGPLPMNSAIVTAGGVLLKEIDPRTMESRLVEGLYLCGEVLDLDADTGGYNLQAAFSTGYIAGESAAEAVAG
ncbi:MAG: BaiN/RdsA family NAD(P)/FAD-dependent oxidoreductase [Armatimonadota bacterium]